MFDDIIKSCLIQYFFPPYPQHCLLPHPLNDSLLFLLNFQWQDDADNVEKKKINKEGWK